VNLAPLDLALESAAVLAAAALGARALRGGAAALRSAVWIAAFAMVACLAPLSALRPTLAVPVYPPALEGAKSGAATPARAGAVAAARPPGTHGARETVIAPMAAGPIRRGGATPRPPITWPGALACAWGLVSAVLLLRVARARAALGRLRRAGTPVADGRVVAVVEDLRRRMGMTRPVRVITSAGLGSPVAFGLRTATIALPEGAERWPEPRLRSALAHELAHLRRRDPHTHLLADLVCAVHWFDPLAWHARARLALERERACDDEAVACGTSPVDYAGHVLWVARHAARRAPAFAHLTMAHRRGLETRIRSLVDPRARRDRLSRAQHGALWIHAGLALAALGLVGGAPAKARDVGPTGAAAASIQTSIARPAPRAAARVEASTDAPRRGIEAPAAGPREDTTPAADPPAVLPLDDPRSEYLAQTAAPQVSAADLASAKDRDAIVRLMRAARHEKQFEHDYVRERAAWALTRVRDGEVVAPLAESLADPDWRVRACAAWALAVTGARTEAPALERRCGDANWRVRAQAAASLRQLGVPPSAETLRRLATDPAWQVRMEAVEVLRRDPSSRTVLEGMANDPHAGTRMQVEAALAELAAR
jgi:beta-lactamase regulating signal transducer with metallopeptidase domain